MAWNKPIFPSFLLTLDKSKTMPYNQMNYKSKVKKTVHKNEGQCETRTYAMD